MAARRDTIPGISVDVAQLVGVRNLLGGWSPALIRCRPGHRAGAREMRVRGRGMEYEESRAYAPGDDMRTMDWQVMARTGEPHTKIFAEEKERRFLLAVDLSPSMFFGTSRAFKSHAAAFTAAHVGWLASFAGDRLGGLVVSAAEHYEVRPGRSRSSLINVFHYLAEATDVALPLADEASRLNFLLRELRRVVKPGSIIALISDFIGIDRHSAELLSAVVRHNDVILYWIHDRTEIEPWPPGRYQVLLRQRKRALEVGGNGNPWLLECQQTHRDRVRALAAQFNLPLLPISCNRDVTAQILQPVRQS